MVAIGTSWHSYPKVHQVGHASIAGIFDHDVIVEEKIDGSQFSWCLGVDANLKPSIVLDVKATLHGDGLQFRSKGQEFLLGAQEKMFNEAVASVVAMQGNLHPGWTYRAEYLKSPKHSSLAYDRIPCGHLMIFDINTGHEEYLSYDEKKAEAKRLGLECAPILYRGRIDSADQLLELLKGKPALGGPMIEGLVVKNYDRFTSDGHAMIGKFVSDNFKEVHKKTWSKDNPTKGDVVDALSIKYRNENRWHKAMQYLREDGKLEGSPRDIGALIKRVQFDIGEECASEIKEALYAWAKPKIMRHAIRGLPEFYKDQLLKGAFDDGESGTEVGGDAPEVVHGADG